ncbi:MAG: hypothetical protein AAF518_19435 [Spirochaetota bacterium]
MLLLGISGCHSPKQKNIYQEDFSFEGWYGPPYNPEGSPKEYFYTKYDDSLPQELEKSSSGRCRQLVVAKANRYAGQKMVFDTLLTSSEIPYRPSLAEKLLQDLKQEGVKVGIKECKSYSGKKLESWQACRCVVFMQIAGGYKEVLARAKAIANE